MKKLNIILIIILIIILVVGGYTIVRLNNEIDEHKESNYQNKSSTKTNVNKTNQILEGKLEGTNIKEFSIDNLEGILSALEGIPDFEDGKMLNVEEYLLVAYTVLNNGYIEYDTKDNKFTESEMNSIVYKIFDVQLKEHKSVQGLIYKNGEYEFLGSTGDAVPVVKNIKIVSSNENTKTVEYDLYLESVMSDEPQFSAKYKTVIKLNSQTGNYYIESKSKI